MIIVPKPFISTHKFTILRTNDIFLYRLTIIFVVMNKFIVVATILCVVLCSSWFLGSELVVDCGVYSNPCEQLPGLSWSTITKYTVSCGLDGYVSKIEKSVKNYPNDYCGSDSFMNNDYSYSLSKADGSTDKSLFVWYC